jgi:Mg/Co/Ni transporter MgtE
MADDRVIVTDGGGGTGAGLIVGVVLGIVILLAVLFFTGTFDRMFGNRDVDIDVNVERPSTPAAPGALLAASLR